MFSQIFDAIEEWMRELLTGMITSNPFLFYLYTCNTVNSIEIYCTMKSQDNL